MSKPITPEQASSLKQGFIPDEVFDVFNELIARSFNGHSATVMQKDAVAAISARISGDIFANDWLDVEDSYRRAGWRVEYDSPAYNETYDAFFRFVRPELSK